MELRQLEMMRAIVECGGYKAAGKRLHLSHPAVHRQIRLLELEIGQRVFQRTGRRVQVTEVGRQLLALGDRIREEIGHALTRIRDIAEMESGALRIGTATTMLMFFLRRVLHRFGREHPKVSVYVSTGRTGDIRNDVANGDLDLGIVFSPPDLREDPDHLREDPLYEEEFVLAVSAGHPLALRKVVSPEDLDGLAFITYSRHSTMRHYLDQRLRSAGIRPKVVMELENEETMAKMLESGMGAAFLSRRRVLADNIRHFRIRGLPLHCPVCLVSLKKGYQSRAAQEFARICHEEGHPLRIS